MSMKTFDIKEIGCEEVFSILIVVDKRILVGQDDGAAIYIENNGIRTVPVEYAEDVKAGKFVDPDVYYFR